MDLNKIMVIGSGPIVIGQAAEFDYAGTQACRALKQEGLNVVLVNSNPATIMTDPDIADRIYIEPLTLETISSIVYKERPDALLATLGGQTGLNMAVSLDEAGVLKETGMEIIGTPLESIRTAEDRELFRQMLIDIGEPVPASAIVRTLEQALEFASSQSYPLIIRPAYTLGGTGGGTAHNEAELIDIVKRGLRLSPVNQVLLEQSVFGFKEIEVEVMRDGSGTCITIASMENIDPMGVHTGDSIVVAPAQTLSTEDYHMLRKSAFRIITALDLQGGANVQYAVDPQSFQYYVIEVNPRVSRSSALASKATGYPIARIAARIAIGQNLTDIENPISGTTTACYEPVLDYVVVKIPRWPFDKFADANRQLGTQMKATGETMGIDRTFEGALGKALSSLEMDNSGLILSPASEWTDEQIDHRLDGPDDERIFAVAEAMRRGRTIGDLHRQTMIDPFFLQKISNMIGAEKSLAHDPDGSALRLAKRYGFCDQTIAHLTRSTTDTVKTNRENNDIAPGFCMVDTSAGTIDPEHPYYYSTYSAAGEPPPDDDRDAVLVLGSGPIRIGQGIEFDYCSVHAALTLTNCGLRSVIINNNPETVSTDIDVADRLYFDPLTPDTVNHICARENISGVIVQCGGQTAISLAEPLSRSGITVLGTSPEAIDKCEDREQFYSLLTSLDINKPEGGAARTRDEAIEVANRIGYPVIVRPSYVIGGRAMQVVFDKGGISSFIDTAARIQPDHPILIDKYLDGIELEVDAICDGTDTLILGIMEMIERSGVHSGDSIAVYPTQSIGTEIKDKVKQVTHDIATTAGICGFINIQFVLADDELYVLEANPRASRTVPFLAKATGFQSVKVATRIMLGHKLSHLGYDRQIIAEPRYVSVKAPVFSLGKLQGVDPCLGPEMKSTGEVMGIDYTFGGALYRTLQAAGINAKSGMQVLLALSDKDKPKGMELAHRLIDLGMELIATADTRAYLAEHGIKAQPLPAATDPHMLETLNQTDIDLAVITPTVGRIPRRSGFAVRRALTENGIPTLTCLDTAFALVQAVATHSGSNEPGALSDYYSCSRQ